jgi:hypothetical protein
LLAQQAVLLMQTVSLSWRAAFESVFIDLSAFDDDAYQQCLGRFIWFDYSA